MTNVALPPEWSPGTPSVTDGDLRAYPVVVLHYWAVWNLHDREMDRRIAALRELYGDRICFRSCDVDQVGSRPFIQGIANVPSLGCFIHGRWVKSVIGLRSEDELRSVIDAWLEAAATPDGGRPLRSGTEGAASFIRKLLRRDPHG